MENQTIPPITQTQTNSQTAELIPTKTAAAELVYWLALGKTAFIVNSCGALFVLILSKFNNMLGLGSCALLCGGNIFILNKVRAELQRLKMKYGV